MEVQLWSSNIKRRNSVKIPYGVAQTTLNGYLREGCSILNPDIVFNLPNTEYSLTYNYAYIKEYKRYYFIEDWRLEQGLWVASMSVDVLATYQACILASKQFVTRSYSKYNEYMIDNIYPTSTDCSMDVYELDADFIKFGGKVDVAYSTFASRMFKEGYVVVGVTGREGSQTGIDYYGMLADDTGLGALISNLYKITPESFGDIGTGLAKQLANPIQYIVSCYWYPACPYDGLVLGSNTIPLGFYKVTGITCGRIDPVKCGQTVNFVDFELGNHPLAFRYGNFLNFEPYSIYELNMTPFGLIRLNGSMLGKGKFIRIEFRNDITTGRCDFIIKSKRSPEADNFRNNVYRGTCQSGVELNFMQKSSDIIGTGNSLISAISDIATGDYLGAISSVGNAITNAFSPKTTGNASVGGAMMWDLNPCVQVQRFDPQGFSPEINGRPLCDYVQLGLISGYCKCENATIPNFQLEGVGATMTEQEQVLNFLNNGFYIETEK